MTPLEYAPIDCESTNNPTDSGQGGRSHRERCARSLTDLKTTGVHIAEDWAQVYADRSDGLSGSLKPYNNLELFYLDAIAYETVQVERCIHLEGQLRERRALLALHCWDDERRLDAELLGKKLGADPGAVRLQLEKTPQGCDWLLERWVGLDAYLERGDVWTEAQRALALNMLAVPEALRQEQTVLDGSDDATALASRKVVARREIDRLTRRKSDGLAEIDAFERGLALTAEEADFPELRRLKRQQRMHEKQLKWYQEQFHKTTRLIDPQIAEFRRERGALLDRAARDEGPFEDDFEAVAATPPPAPEAPSEPPSESSGLDDECADADFTVGRGAAGPPASPSVLTIAPPSACDPIPARTVPHHRTEEALQFRGPSGPPPD